MNPFMYLFLTTLGMIWQGVLAYILLRREVQPFTWEGIKNRLWLFTPANPKTGVRSKWMFLWTIPLVTIMQFCYRFGILDPLNNLLVKTFPSLTPPPYTLMKNLSGPAVGQWWLLAVLAVMIVFNYFVGEELIFRGILLPKMNGVFGKWDFLANHMLFVTYHLHRISDWPALLVIDWINPWATKRFNSYWVGVILHAVEAVMPTIMFPLAIMGFV
jgi:membrane protease YdiL (CAAX protease family)